MMVDLWTIGDGTIHRIEECILPPETGSWLLPGLTGESGADVRFPQQYADSSGALMSSTQSFGVVADGVRLLVDTGIGNGKSRANPAWDRLDTDFLDRLEAAGFAPENVDMVLQTHLHADHVGWNTSWNGSRWVPTFASARYVMNRTEREYWKDVHLEPSRREMIEDSIAPVENSGLLDTPNVPAGGLPVTPSVHLIPTPGHTPGHVSVLVSSGGDKALIGGDFLHHPAQIDRPDIGSSVDVDAELSARTRGEILDWVADENILLLGSHFPDPAGGFVRKTVSGFRFDPWPG